MTNGEDCLPARDLNPLIALCFWCRLTTSLAGWAIVTENVLFQHWRHPRACGSCGCYFYRGRIRATSSKPPTRGRKAEAINFYGYCLTNANAIIVFEPPSHSRVYLVQKSSRNKSGWKKDGEWLQFVTCEMLRLMWVGWVGGGRVEVLLPFLAATSSASRRKP